MNRNTRIEFLNAPFKRATIVATAEFLPKSASSSETADTTGSTSIAASGGNSTGHYKPTFQIRDGRWFALARNLRLLLTRSLRHD